MIFTSSLIRLNHRCNYRALFKHARNIAENLFFFLLLGIILILPSALCAVYKYVVYTALKWRHRKTFFAMMDGDETTWALQRQSRGQIVSMFVHAYDTSVHGDIVAAFRRQIDGCAALKRTCPKLFARRGYCAGYYYFRLDFAQRLVWPMREYESVADLNRLLGEYGSCCEPLGADDDQMMQVLVGTKPINWTNDGRTNLYPVIVRTHHSLGDGVSMNCLFIQALMRNPGEFLRRTYEEMLVTRKNIPNGIRRKEGRWWRYLVEFWNLASRARYAPPMLRRYDANLLHGVRLSGEKHLVWSRDASDAYVRKIKEIKRCVPNASFNAVIMAAIATTFNEYFQEKAPRNVPKFITSSLVTLPKIPKFNEMVEIDTNGTITNIDMTNKYVICALKLPMQQTLAELDALKNIELTNLEIEKLKNSLDIPVLLLCNRLIAKLLPVPLVKLLMRSFNTTFAISNLPGFDRGELWHGGHIEDLYFWIPNTIRIGIGISIFSSNGRLEMGLNVDKAVIGDAHEAHALLARVLHHIDAMHEKSGSTANRQQAAAASNNASHCTSSI